MKGVAEIEFIISVFVFITTISFVTVVIINNVPIFRSAAFADTMKSSSWQYSEMLIFDEGFPRDWNSHTQDVKRIGLSSGSGYLLDSDKILKLYSLCSGSGYANMKSVLGLDPNSDILIQVSYLDGIPVAGSTTICAPAVITQLRPQAQTTRLAVLNTIDRPVVRLSVTVM